MKLAGISRRSNKRALFLLALLTGFAPAVWSAPVDSKTPPVDKEQAEQPFQGKVEAVDATART